MIHTLYLASSDFTKKVTDNHFLNTIHISIEFQ